MPDYKIKLASSPEEVTRLYEFIKSQPLDYPDYMLWVEKCRRELELGSKKAFVCLAGEEIAANLVFQAHKQHSFLLELKNGRVGQEFRRKGIFTKLVCEAQRHASENGFRGMICDCHPDNLEMMLALKSSGLVLEAQEDLYNRGQEAIMFKRIE